MSPFKQQGSFPVCEHFGRKDAENTRREELLFCKAWCLPSPAYWQSQSRGPSCNGAAGEAFASEASRGMPAAPARGWGDL